jgi:hypothetical protein
MSAPSRHRSRAGAGTPAAAPAAAGARCGVLELRQYTLRPQCFDRFLTLFEDEFVDPLEAAGMVVIGQFRDLDDPDRFVWLRGFADMATRARALQAFYGGSLWAARRDAANANFIDTDDVLLLRPLRAGTTFACDPRTRPPRDGGTHDAGMLLCAVYPLRSAVDAAFGAAFASRLRPALAAAGIDPLAVFATEPSVNDFPRLPVREGEHVLVWVAAFAERAAADRALAALDPATCMPPATAHVVRDRLLARPQLLRLAATPRSLLRGRPV